MKTFLLVHTTSTACSDLVLTSGLNRFEVEVRVRVQHLVVMDTFEDRHWELLTVSVLMHVFVVFKTTAKLLFFPPQNCRQMPSCLSLFSLCRVFSNRGRLPDICS